jgi:hypothetical protein
MTVDLDDVLVTLDHPAGTVEVPLAQWIRQGPGPRRFVRPIAARSQSTGEILPLTVIPLAYRNDDESRARIAAGEIAAPWPPWTGAAPAFDTTVADPSRVDQLTVRVLAVLPHDIVEDDDVRRAVNELPTIGDDVSHVLRRLAARARWDEFARVANMVRVVRMIEAGPVLCELLESDLEIPDPGGIVDALGALRLNETVTVLIRQLGRFLAADADVSQSLRCLHALGAVGTNGSHAALTFIAKGHWPEEIRAEAARVLAQEGDADGDLRSSAR